MRAPPATETARILVADDRPEILRMVERTLGGSYRCELTGSVAEARSKLAEEEFELALCDIQMPGESGLVLVEEISRAHPDTAVVLVTGVDDPEVAERTFRLGAHGYLVKPFWPGQLKITVMSALRRRKLEIAQRAHSRTLEERMQTLMDRAPVPIYVKDGERRYVIANRAAHELAGLDPGGLIGARDGEIMSPQSERLAAASDRLVLEQGETYEGEEALIVEGEERTFLTVKFPYVDDAGEIRGIYVISVDLTAKHMADELQEELALAQQRAIEELQSSRQETVERLSRAIEQHDAETGRHVHRMAAVAAYLAGKLGFDRERVLLLRAAAPMHDVGKIATPDEILHKEDPLSDEERREMERHTIVGHQILAGSDSELLRIAARVALSHHEWYDGSGYPQGLADDEIPIEGRIVAVADVFDALLSDRSYRPAMTVKEATELIREGRGTHFDPEIADLLLDNVEEVLALRG